MNMSFTNFLSGHVTNSFVGTALKTHKRIGKLLERDIITMSSEEVGIHKNYFAYIQNSELTNNPFTNVNQQVMINRLLQHNIRTFWELYREKTSMRFPNLYLDVFQLYNTYPVHWRKLITKTNRSHNKITGEIPFEINKWVSFENSKIKQISKYLLSEVESTNPKQFLINKHKMVHHIGINNIEANPFVEINKITKDVKIKNIQYKLLHNIYPTMKHLYLWKIKETANCNLCGIEEDLKHAIYDCPVARDCWQQIQTLLNNQTGNLEYQDILMGLSSRPSGFDNRLQLHSIDLLIILLKQKLILQREEKQLLTHNELINIINNWIKTEKYIAIKNNKINNYNKKWSWIENILNQP